MEKGYYKGVKVISHQGGFHVDNKIQFKIYDTCLKLNMPALFHVGWYNAGSVNPENVVEGENSCKYSCVGLPVEFGTLLETYPKLKVVFAHMGADHYFQCMGMAWRFSNVYLDTAWLEHYGIQQLPQITIGEWISHACRYLGADRIL